MPPPFALSERSYINPLGERFPLLIGFANVEIKIAESYAADKPLLVLLLGCALFLGITMPGGICTSDAYVSRIESANIIMSGGYGVDYALREQLGEYAAPNIMILNDEKGKIYSWYGILNTVVYLPVSYAVKLFAGRVDFFDFSLLYIFFINLNNIVFSLIIIFYLYRISGLFSDSNWQKVLFVTLSVLSTNLWFYLRSQHHEIFQITMFLGFTFHFILFLRAAEKGDEARKWKNLMWSSLWLAMLFLTKVYYATMIATAFAFALASGEGSCSLAHRIKHNLLYNKIHFMVNLVLPVFSAVVITLLVNKVRTGLFLSTGYADGGGDFQGEIAFSFKALAESIPGLLVNKGNCNLFFHYPLFFFALFGLRRFFCKRPLNAFFVSFVFVTNFSLLACFHGWDGGMSYGPRYFLPFLVIGSLPFMEFTHYLAEHIRRWWGLLVSVGVVGIFLYSIGLQICVNSIGDFTGWTLAYKFDVFNDQEIDDYFSANLTRASIYRDVLLFKAVGRKFPPLELAKERYIPAVEQATFDDYLRSTIDYDLLALRLFSTR